MYTHCVYIFLKFFWVYCIMYVIIKLCIIHQICMNEKSTLFMVENVRNMQCISFLFIINIFFKGTKLFR